MEVGLHVKGLQIFPILTNLIFLTDLTQSTIRNFTNNPPSGSKVVPYGRTEDMTKPVVAFRNFSNAIKTIKYFYFTNTKQISKVMVKVNVLLFPVYDISGIVHQHSQYHRIIGDKRIHSVAALSS